MRFFFIDYENVNKEGLKGVAKLTGNDYVRIYYTDNAETLTFGLHRRITESYAQFEYIKVKIIKSQIGHKAEILVLFYLD